MTNAYQHIEISNPPCQAVSAQATRKTATQFSIPTLQKEGSKRNTFPPQVPIRRKRHEGETPLSQKKVSPPTINNTGMPDWLKSGIETLSGFSMDDVNVHYNSSQPVQLNALAYAKGSNIHIAPGQERHLPHEAWHVVQQKQGRVQPTMQMKDIAINDDKGLEKEADVMGNKAIQTRTEKVLLHPSVGLKQDTSVAQLVKSISVTEDSSQSLIDPGKSSAVEYKWKSSFVIYLYDNVGEVPKVRVVIFIATAASDDVFDSWNKSIKRAWSNKFAIKSIDKFYPIQVEIFRASSEFKNYSIENVKQDVSLGVRGFFGTESMTRWGEGDPQDIPHEVGHMLGNKDEYGTVDGKDWSKEYVQQNPDTHSIMHKGDEPPRMRHFNLIFQKVRTQVGFQEATMIKMSGVKHIVSPSRISKPITPTVKSGLPSSAPSTEKIGKPVEKFFKLGVKGSVPPEITMEIGTRLHNARVEKITEYLLNNIKKLTPEQETWLEKHNWAINERDSAEAIKKLGI